MKLQTTCCLSLLLFIGTSCEDKSSSDTPDCNGGANAYIEVCRDDQAEGYAEANGQIVYDKCKALAEDGTDEGVQQALDLVDCLEGAGDCDAAETCTDTY